MPILRVFLLMSALGLGLSGCGVRGDLEPPPGAAAVAAQAEQPERVAVEAPVAAGPLDALDPDDERTERVIESQRRGRYPPMSDSFVLDPLL